MSQVTEQSVRFQTALASIKLIQASAVLDLTEDDFDFLTSNKVWIATDRSRARRCVEACVYGTLDFVGYPRFRSEERFSRNAETDLVCRLLLEKKKRATAAAGRSDAGKYSRKLGGSLAVVGPTESRPGRKTTTST